MTQYKIFKNPLGQMEAIKQGWSWPGFVFGPIWALFKKMWALGIGTLVGGIILISILEAILGNIGNGLGAGISVMFGMYGNKWREGNLKYRGYDEVSTIIGSNPEGAVATYLKQT